MPATPAASTLRREMLSMLLPCYVQSGMTADGAGSVDQCAGEFNSTISANLRGRPWTPRIAGRSGIAIILAPQRISGCAAHAPGMTENLDFCPCHAVPNQGIQYAQ